MTVLCPGIVIVTSDGLRQFFPPRNTDLLCQIIPTAAKRYYTDRTSQCHESLFSLPHKCSPPRFTIYDDSVIVTSVCSLCCRSAVSRSIQILLQEFLICLEIHLQHGHFTMGRILIRAFNGNTVLYNIVCQDLRCHKT